MTNILFVLSHHGTWQNGETFFNERVVHATDADALVQWATNVCYAGWNSKTQAITIARLTPCVIQANSMKLEGSSKWMVGASSIESVLWSTDHNTHEQEMGMKNLRNIIEHQNLSFVFP